jgi:hypothetical protein
VQVRAGELPVVFVGEEQVGRRGLGEFGGLHY